MQVEAGLVQMRETAYGKVLQCLPYPRELVSPASSTWQCATGLMYMAMHVILLSSWAGAEQDLQLHAADLWLSQHTLVLHSLPRTPLE